MTMRVNRILWTGFIAFSLALTAAAATPVKAKAKTGKSAVPALAKMNASPASWDDGFALSPENFPKDATVVPTSKESNARGIANSTGLFDDSMSQQYKDFQKKFLSIQNVSEIDPLLTKLQQDYETLPTDLKLVAAQLIPLQTFKSFVWRAVPVFKKNNKTNQELILQFLRVYAGIMAVSGSDARWRPFFEYVTEPWGNYVGYPERFNTEVELQQFMANDGYTTLLKAHTRTKKLKLSSPVIWDNQLTFGNVAFADNLDRYKKITSSEQLALLAHQSKALRDLAMLVAYNWKNSFDLQKKIAKHFGIDAIGFGSIEGITRKEEIDLITKTDKYDETFQCLPSLKEKCTLTQAWMQRAYKHAKDYYTAGRMAWDRTKNSETVDFAIIDASFFRGHKRQIEQGFDNVCLMLGDDCTYPKQLKTGAVAEVGSPITKEMIKVNAKAFFMSPTSDLKLLLPNDFEDGDKDLRRGKDDYRNYFRGRATSWRKEVYEVVFPGLPSGLQVGQYNRILAEVRGGDALGLGVLTAFAR